MSYDTSNVYYSAAPGMSGTDSFTYSITDNNGGFASATVNVNVTNGAPVAEDDSATVAAGGFATIDVLANDNDPDDDREKGL